MASYGHSIKEARVPKKYEVSLDDGQRSELERLVRSGESPARKLLHARVLLKADEGQTDQEVAESVEVSVRTVERVRRRFVGQGPGAALVPKPAGRVYARKLDGGQEARLVALARSAPPGGRKRWTMRLPAGRLVELEVVDGVSHETVRQVLKRTRRSRG